MILVAFQKQIKNQGEENHIYEKNSELLLVNLVSTLVIPIMYFGNENVKAKQIKTAKKFICNNLTDKRTIKKVTNNFISLSKINTQAILILVMIILIILIVVYLI